MKKKVMIGMSGGVDSSVAALLLQQQGYEVVGVTFKLWDSLEQDSRCCSADDVEDARSVCASLGIPHYVFNYKELFQQEVMDYFVSEYQRGFTPNPCIACNRRVKFSAFLQRAIQMDFDYIATGHYAKTIYNSETQRYNLLAGAFDNKDQSYVLYCMTQEQLAHLLLPLGDRSKEEIRRIAEEHDLVVSHKPDSQDICFVPHGNYTAFLEKYTGTPSPKGNFVDIHGVVLGKHQGIWNYTIGQRKGLGISFGKPMFVADIDPISRNVTLGAEDSLMGQVLFAEDCNLIAVEEILEPTPVLAKIRYSHPKAPATVYPMEGNRFRLVFDSPQRAITKGQAVVLYQGDQVFGGGTVYAIEK